MYFVHLNNPTRQVRVDANSISVLEGFVTFSMRAHPEDYAPATVAVFRAEDVATVYNQDHIQSVIALPNVGSGGRIPFETTQRVEPSAEYAPAIIRQGYTASSMDSQLNTATQARQYPPLAATQRYHNGTYEDPLGMRPLPESDYPDPVPALYDSSEQDRPVSAGVVATSALAAWSDEDTPARVPTRHTYDEDRINQAVQLADRFRPAPPLSTREPFRVTTENMMATTSGPRLYVTADEMYSSAQALAAGENF